MKKFFGSYGIAFVLAIIAGVLKKDGVEAAYNILFTASFISVVYLEVKKEEGFLRGVFKILCQPDIIRK